MAGEDLVFAGVASALLRNAKPASTTTPPTGSSPTVSFTAEQLDQLAGAVAEGVRSVEFPAPVVNVPAPVVNVSAPELPSNLEVRFTDAEIQKLASAMAGTSAFSTKLIETRVLTLNFNGGILTSALFPTLYRVASYEFTQDYFLVAVSLSCSLVNITPDVSGLFFGRDLGERINIQQQSETDTSSDIFISQLTHQNSTLATISPLSRTNTVAFGGDTVFIPVQAGTKLAIYACGNNTVANLYSAVASIHVTKTLQSL